jgi:hypothetical protein
LDRCGHRKFKVLCFRAHRNDGPAQFGFSSQRNIGAEPKNRPPEKKVGLNSQERLAKSHETRNVQKRVRCELVKLHTVNENKPTKELVGRERQTTEEESEEHYPITTRGLRDTLCAWKLDRILGGDEAVRPGLLHLLLRDGRFHLAGRSVGFSLGHGVLAS